MANDGKLVVIMIFVLISFGIGAVVGISVGITGIDTIADDNLNDTHVENVTKEMTTDLDKKEEVVYDPEIDHVDFNENITLN